MITLVAIICLGPICQDVAVPTKIMQAGNADHPIPYTMSWTECSVHGQQIALDWLAEENKHNSQYAGWILKPPIKCVPGKYEPSGHA
jgi:hypothetical protein